MAVPSPSGFSHLTNDLAGAQESHRRQDVDDAEQPQPRDTQVKIGRHEPGADGKPHQSDNQQCQSQVF